jgi:serine/threonine protein kinase/TolB-like protein/Tfp pilus assembly protein PilF
MTPARFQTIEEIFLAALEQEPDQISAFLDTACDGDQALRREVEVLLASDQKAGRFIESSAVGLATNIIQNQQTDSLVGQTIGHYKISESIGAGGMGEVYLATDIIAGRRAALKLVPFRFTGDAERLKRFQQEAHAVVGLNHPNIVTVYEIGEDYSIHYIASELIEGETLRDRLKRGPVQLSEAVDVAIQVASALAAAHQAGIVHRDIKPENIMVRPDGYVKVLDFGIAKLAEQEVPATMPRDEALLLVETNLGSVLGTVRYMSPEQARGGQVDKSTDIWSLGVVLYEMVIGQTPFTGDTPQDVMSSILEKESPPLTRYIAHAPAELQQIISKTLHKDRRQRYPSAHELLEALKGLRHKLEVKAELERSTAAAQAELQMAAETAKQMALEIGHVLFVDIVSYSQLSINEQHAAIAELTQTVRSTDQFRKAEGANRLIKIATGDGMALVFYTSPEAPVRCAMEISGALKQHPRLHIRMGIHSGPVSSVTDVTGHTNLAGAGLNLAQRVMECGDAGHILLSKHVAEDLSEFQQWRPLLHDLGTCEVKHGVRISVVNLWSDDVGNRQPPQKFRALRKHTRVRWAEAAAALLLFAAIAAAFVLVSRKPPTAISTVPEKGVAVLPFQNLSKDEENAYFAGGVQDEILTDLAKIADLKVISRTSVMKYKSDLERNLREIAKALGVSYVVEGSVQRAGERVRVNVQLIDARNDRHLWAEHYDRDVADVFAIQSEIAQQIAEQLQAKLSPAEKAAIAERPTTDLVAYAYYTKAQEIDVWSNWEGWEKSANQKVELLEKAVQRDPNFALAYCVLAKTQLYLAHDPKHFELAKKAAEAALRVRPDLGEAHLELARYYFYAAIFTDRNGYDRARDELTIARRKLPNNSEALLIAGKIDRNQNRWDSAVANLRKATELDPRDAEAGYWRGMTYFEMRRYSEYEQLLTKDAASGDPWSQCLLARIKLAQGDPVAAQSLLDQVPLDFRPAREVWWPRFDAALYLRDYDAASRVIASTPGEWADEAAVAEGQVARARGDKQKALAAFATAREKTDAIRGPKDDIDYLRAVSEIDAGLGRKDEAIREAQRAVDLTPIAKDPLERTYAVVNLALVYAWTGERDRALEQLEIVAAIPAGPTYGDLLLNPCWDSLRGDKRFDKIVAAAKAASK